MSDSVEWHQLPGDAGQIVDVRYSINWEDRVIYRRTHDRSDDSVVVSAAGVVDGSDRFEPWNGVLPSHGEWKEVGDG